MKNLAKNEVIKLAENSLENGKINDKIARFVLKNLSKVDLQLYYKTLKSEVKKSTVNITSAEKLSPKVKNELEKTDKNKIFTYSQDPNMGPGLIIRDNDDVLNLSLKEQINTVIKSVVTNL